MATQYVQDKEGSTFIPASQRPDGSWRKPRKVKQGFVPAEEVPLYESKGKKFVKEQQAQEGLPAGLTREAWEKMKEAQAKLLNPQQKTAAKKKNNKKKSTTNNNTTVNDNQNVESNDNVINQKLEQHTTTTNVGSTGGAKKKKNKTKQTGSNNENNSSQVNNSSPSNSASQVDDWVTMGKPKQQQSKKGNSTTANLEKATSAVESLRLDNKKSSRSQQPIQNRIDQLPVSKGVDELANDMLIDDHDDDNEEAIIKEKNNEKQQLVKKIKTLKKKLKDVETLKELSKTKTLDKEQNEKVSKAEQFAKDLAKLQIKLDKINESK